MKKIAKTDLPGAKILTPLEMNRIIFETGRHSDKSASPSKTTSSSPPRR